MLERLTRREFSASIASIVGLHLLGGDAAARGSEVTTTSEAIHQEVAFNGTAARVYAALTDAARFTAVTKFSSVKDAPPAQISRDVGGTFSLFGGHIVGRHLELVAGKRIVQAWRVADWDPGAFSIATFQLSDRGAKAALVFDHVGFPNGLGEHLAQGWHANYWDPLAKYFG